MDKVRLGIIGCGTISQLNAPGYLSHPKCEVVALFDPDRERATRRAQEWGISPRVHSSFEDVLNDNQVDAVELLTPTSLHAEQSIAALGAGKHVSCQKPHATNLAEADAIIDAVKGSDRTFRVTENFLYYPPLVKAKELVDSGATGDPSMVRIRTVWGGRDPSSAGIKIEPDARAWRRDPSSNAGGLVCDDGWHKVATAMWWVGEIESVTAMVTRTEDFMIEAPSAAICKYANRDCLAVFEYAYAPNLPFRTRYFPADEFFEIIGSKGVLWVTRCTGEMLDMPPVILHSGDSSTSYQVSMDWMEGFKGAARDFVDSLLTDKQPQMDAYVAKKVLQTTLAVYQASETGHWTTPDSLT